MKMTTITYDRKFGRPNYGSEGMSLTAEIDPSESPAAVAYILKALVYAQLEEKQAARGFLNAAYAAQDSHIPPEGWYRRDPDEMLNEAKRFGMFDE